MILLIDNYDSFVHNLARYLRRLGCETIVVRNDAIDVAGVRQMNPSAIVLSPGPCAPAQAGCCLEVIRQLHSQFPMLGVCLGHQAIAQAFGGQIIRAAEPVHGRASLMRHDGSGVFAGLDAAFMVGRYHSLVACPQSLPACLRVNATLQDGTIMAVEHVEYPVVGWQFHPESVLTEHGYELLQSFLNRTVLAANTDTSAIASELGRAMPVPPDWFTRAIEYPIGQTGDGQAGDATDGPAISERPRQ